MNRALRVCVILLLVGVAVGPLMGTGLAQEQTPTAGANETRHVDPDDANDDGDLGGLQAQLARRLSERLENSSVKLSQGQYDAADELLGEEYQEQYGKYVDIAGDVEGGDRSGELERARERQQEYVESVRTYNQTREEYRDAKANGNEQRAKQLARELEQQSENVSSSSNKLQRTFQNVSNRTGVSFETASAAVTATTENVSTQQSEIRTAEFDPTNLTVRAQSTRGSYAEPVVLDGRLLTENGTAIANQTITLELRSRRVSTRTDATGRFTTEVRPVRLPLGNVTTSVRYVPSDSSAYLGSRSNVSFVVEQTESTTTLESVTPQAAFNESISVTGQVESLGEGVSGVPVVLRLGGQRLARTYTTENGTFQLNGPVPTAVPAGTQSIDAAVALKDRALAASNASRELQVRKTATELTLTTNRTNTTVTLTGRLTTAGGVAVPGEELDVSRNGSLVATARTTKDGRYTVTVPVNADERYRVTVQYEDPRTNLANASATTEIANVGANAAGGVTNRVIAFATGNPLAVGGGATLLVAFLFGGVFLIGGRDEEDPIRDPDAATPEVTETTGTQEELTLDDAEMAVNEHANAAVERAYQTIRAKLRTQGIGSDDATHWEFFDACQSADVEHPEAVETLTRLYEQAAFDPNGVSRADAERALDEAGRFV